MQPRSNFMAFVFVLTLVACTEKPTTPPVSPAVVIDGAQIWDGTGSPPVQDAILVMKGDYIEDVGARGAVSVPPGAKTVSGKGKTLIPGLINMHGHLGMTKGLKMARENYSKENILAQ